jgi:mediator of RNA polymerase II transcription subunit 14
MSEIQKLGPAARGTMYIQLANFPTHYLVLVLTDEEFRYALISTKMLSDTMFGNMIMEDIGWLDVRRIRGDRGVDVGMDEVGISSMSHEPLVLQKRNRDDIPSELSRSEDRRDILQLPSLYC